MLICLRIVAAGSNGNFIAVDNRDYYFVLASEQSRRIKLGDRLKGNFDGLGKMAYTIRNLRTRQEKAVRPAEVTHHLRPG